MKIINNKKEAFQELKRISCRTALENNDEINKTVEQILHAVKNDGDQAVEEYTKKFDGYIPDPMQINENDLKEAWNQTDADLKSSLEIAHERIKKFHEQEIPKSFIIKGEFGDSVQRKWSPVKRAGIYIPGGRASYPSTVLMNAIPAKVAGVEEIIMVSPGNKNGAINKTVFL